MLDDHGRSSKWINVERFAYTAAITPNEAADILRKVPEIVFDKGKNGRLIAKLRSVVTEISDADYARTQLSTIAPMASKFLSEMEEDLKNDTTRSHNGAYCPRQAQLGFL